MPGYTMRIDDPLALLVVVFPHREINTEQVLGMEKVTKERKLTGE